MQMKGEVTKGVVLSLCLLPLYDTLHTWKGKLSSGGFNVSAKCERK